FDLHEQDPAAIGRQGKSQRAGYRRLAGAPLAGNDVQPHALPVAVTSPHWHQAIVAPLRSGRRVALQPPAGTAGAARAGRAQTARGQHRRGSRRPCSHVSGLSLGWMAQKAAALAARSGRKGVIPMLAALLVVLIVLIVAGLTLVGRSLRVVQQYERGL